MDTQSIQTEPANNEQPTNSAHIVVLQNDYQAALGLLETAYNTLNQVEDPEARAQAQAALVQINDKYSNALQVANHMDLFVLGINAQMDTIRAEMKAIAEELEATREEVVEANDAGWAAGYDAAVDDMAAGDPYFGEAEYSEGYAEGLAENEQKLDEANERIKLLEEQLAEKQAALEDKEAILAELDRLENPKS